MEIDVPQSAPVTDDLPPYDQVHIRSDSFTKSPPSMPCSSNPPPSTLPSPISTLLAGTTQASSDLHPHEFHKQHESVQVANQLQQAGSNGNSQREGQKKASRFLLEVPQLSRPQRSVTNNSATPVVTPSRAQFSSISIPRPTTKQAALKERRIITPQKQMPTLHTPSRPKLPSLAQQSATSTPSQDNNTPPPVDPKPALHKRNPTQLELSRPADTCVMQSQLPRNNTLPQNNDLFQPPPPPPPTPTDETAMAITISIPQGDGATDSNSPIASTCTQQSPEFQAVETASNSAPNSTPQYGATEEGQLEPNHVDAVDSSSIVNVAEVQIQQPLPSTTPTYPETNATTVDTITNAMTVDMASNSAAIASNMEMADPSNFSEQAATFNSYNPPPHEMEATSNIQEQTDTYAMYGGELYQQPYEQMQMVNIA